MLQKIILWILSFSSAKKKEKKLNLILIILNIILICFFFILFTESVRCLGGINRWNDQLNKEIHKDIEKHWSSKTTVEKFDENSDKEKFYILSMFPYPSGSLHMGHVRVYCISDVLARYYRLKGKNVIHPMGWDAFGLPAENAALERGLDPDLWTQKNIATMKSLMEKLNLSFDWSREFATCDSDYYKWTQFLFLKLFENGLAYRKEAVVNWDPVDKTVLANEQVDEKGCSWRSGAVVEKKMLKQWFVKTTRFSKELYEGLNSPILENWKDVIDLQKHWLGTMNGTTIDFKIVNGYSENEDKSITIWIKRPEYIDRARFVAVKPESTLAKEANAEGLLPFRLRNPFTNENLPVYVTDKVYFAVGSEVHLGIPDLSPKDKDFATLVGIPYSEGLYNYAREEELLDLREKICAEARERGIGGYPASSKLKDWLISRQRYWGTPIPIIHCEKCGEQAVPENELPVRLPKVSKLKLGQNPLIDNKDWFNVNCPKCGGKATRETDTMDTFVDSSWYYLRFLDPDNEEAAFGVEKIKKLMPVDIYIGGKEHAILHLYFARFMNNFLYSMGLVPHSEPFKKLLCQGMVRGKTYRSEQSGEYVKRKSVEKREDQYYNKETGEVLVLDWEKMSKSKHNGVDPKDLIDEYGVDTTRLVVLSMAAPQSYLDWDEKPFSGIINWQHRLWVTVAEFINIRSENLKKPEENDTYKKLDFFMFDSRNFYLNKVTYVLDRFGTSIAISKMQGLTNALGKANKEVVAFSINYEKALALQIILLSPFCPSFASELWAGFTKAPNRLCQTGEISWDLPLSQQKLPVVDPDYKMRSEEVQDMLKLHKYKSKTEVKQLKKLKKKSAAEMLDSNKGETHSGAEGDQKNLNEKNKKSKAQKDVGS